MPDTRTLLAIALLSLTASALRSQGPLVAEGMVTPKDATTEAEIVVVQTPTARERPGPPVVLSTNPPRLLLASQLDATSAAPAGRSVAQSAGPLSAATWEAVSYRVDWSSGTPDLDAVTGPGSFVVSRGEVYARRLTARAGQGFRLDIDGPWDDACVPAIDRVVRQSGRLLVYAERTDTTCVPPDDRPVDWRATAQVVPLAAGRYEVEVRIPSASNPQVHETYATASLRVVGATEARVVDLRLEADLARGVETLVAEIERPVTVGGSTCSGWEVTARNAWVHGRDIYAQFELEQVSLSCTAPKTLRETLPLPKLEPGLYRLIAQREDLGSGSPSEFWAQSAKLARSRPPSQQLDGRFDLSVTWRDHSGGTGHGVPALADGGDSAVFYFFDPDNWELLAKVLDGCAINGHYWVFASASTDVEYRLEVHDLETGRTTSYDNPLGTASPAITDTTALDCE